MALDGLGIYPYGAISQWNDVMYIIIYPKQPSVGSHSKLCELYALSSHI
jgi:hypothetical protein